MNPPIPDLDKHLGDVYQEINQEVIRVHAYWKLTLQLFGTNESVEILNRAGGFAIRAIQDSLIETTLLRIAKLTDPKQQGSHSNLSLDQLLEHLNNLPEIIQNKLTDQLKLIKKIYRKHLHYSQ